MEILLGCSKIVDGGPGASLGVESMPEVTPYRYASAWPRIFGVEPVDLTVEMEPGLVKAAAAIIKVASWANGYLDRRTWDTISTPLECPEPGEVSVDDTALGGVNRLPVYNCVSLPHFAVGLETLHTLASPIGWVYEEAEPDEMGIVRLLEKGRDPNTEDISEGHWMVILGRSGEVVVDSPQALEVLGSGEKLSLHVNGGDGPLLISVATAVVDFYAHQCGTEMSVYRAIPAL